MAVFVAWGNINRFYPLDTIPSELLTEKLRRPPKEGNARVQTRNRSRWVAHFLLWELCKTARIPTALLGRIYRAPSGRPQFPPEHIDFNISHSGDWVAVILNVNENPAADRRQTAVGIDIEAPRKERDFVKLLHYFAAPQEQDWFARRTDKATAFYRIWCMREAVLKSLGAGITKLGEVSHLPEQRIIRSAYCPPGQFVFTAELPFYLAVFSASGLPQGRYFAWNGEELSPYTLKSAVDYQVNF